MHLMHDCLTVLVDHQGHAVQVAGNRRELLDYAILPDRWFELKDLRGWAGRIGRVCFCHADNLSFAVNGVRGAAATTKCWQGSCKAELPEKRRTRRPQRGIPRLLEATKVFAIRIFGGGFCRADGLATSLMPKSMLFFPPSSAGPKSPFQPLNQRTACMVPSAPTAPPLIKPFGVMLNGWPGGPPTTPRSVTV